MKENKTKYRFNFIVQFGKDGRFLNKKIVVANCEKLPTKEVKSFKISNILMLIFGGLLVGFLNGFFGGGGGMIVVPLLIWIGLADKQAHATAIFTILPISVASSIVYFLNNSIQFDNLAFTSLGFTIGGIFGALLLKKLNNNVIRILFSLIMIGVGIKIILS